MSEQKMAVPVIEMRNISLTREGRTILDTVNLSVLAGQRWVVLGSNGCGKTTLMRIMSLYLHPSHGDIRINGHSLGTFDIRPVRPRIAYMSASLASELRPELSAHDVVMTARYGALETWWHEYADDDHARADYCLERMGMLHFSHRAIGTLSSGEQQRVLLARVLMNDPMAVLLDEPSARLDLGGREQLVQLLDRFADENPALPSVLVTHHVDEIPESTTHCALVRNGQIIAQGALYETLTSDTLSQCFGVRLNVDTRPNGRLTAYAP